jgi:hypothetical protein
LLGVGETRCSSSAVAVSLDLLFGPFVGFKPPGCDVDRVTNFSGAFLYFTLCEGWRKEEKAKKKKKKRNSAVCVVFGTVD